MQKSNTNKKKNIKTAEAVRESNILSTVTLTYSGFLLVGLPLFFADGFRNITEAKSAYYFIISILFLLIIAVTATVGFSLKKQYTGILKHKRKQVIIDYAMTAFFACCLISAAISQYSSDVWFGASSRYQGVLTLLIYCLMYLAVSYTFIPSNKLIMSAMVAFSIVAIIGIMNCFGLDILGIYLGLSKANRAKYISTIGNVNFYSAYFCLLLPVSVYKFCCESIKKQKIILSVFLVIGSFGMMVTSSESFAVGFFISLAIIGLFMMKDVKQFRSFLVAAVVIIVCSQIYKYIFMFVKKVSDGKPCFVKISAGLKLFTNPAVAVTLVVICVLLYVLLNKKPGALPLLRKLYIAALISASFAVAFLFTAANTFMSDVKFSVYDKFLKFSPEWGTNRGRNWAFCFNEYLGFNLKQKLFGIGPESLYHLTLNSELYKNKVLDQTHNEFLQYLITTGIFGLVSYIGVIVTTVVSVLKKLRDNTLAMALLSGLIAYWIQSFFNLAQPFTTPIMYFFIAVLAGLLYRSVNNVSAE